MVCFSGAVWKRASVPNYYNGDRYLEGRTRVPAHQLRERLLVLLPGLLDQFVIGLPCRRAEFLLHLRHPFAVKPCGGTVSEISGDTRWIRCGTSAESIRRALSSYDIGRKLRQLRLRKREVQENLHDGAEFIFVLKGTLGIRFEGEEHRLKEGDRGIGKSRARAVMVTTPPRI